MYPEEKGGREGNKGEKVIETTDSFAKRLRDALNEQIKRVEEG